MGSGVPIRVLGLTHDYGANGTRLRVLSGLDLAVEAGGYCTLRGASGAGKSTLLAVLGGLERPQAGSVRVGDVDLHRLAGDDLAAYRRRTVGFVFQHFGLLETLTALENVELAATLAGVPLRRRRARARELLAGVGLEDRADHRPGQLSGGERQRAAMARALVNEPSLMLCDEPTGNLDEESALRTIDLLEDIRRETGCTLVIVTHNRAIGDRAPQRLCLTGGRIVPA